MTVTVSVVISTEEGGRALLRTADSVARQRRPPGQMLLATSGRTVPLADSIVRRLRASIVTGEVGAAAINAAVHVATGDVLAVLPAGLELHPDALEMVARAFHREPSLSALASPLRVHTPDGLASLEWHPPATSAVAMLTDPRGVSPVMFARRAAWIDLGGLDSSLGDLAVYELWLRLALRQYAIDVLREPVVSRELPDRPLPADDATEYLSSLRRVFDSHRDDIERLMDDVLVAREVRFGLLREAHRRLIDERDTELAALDDLRAEAAHHRSYLEYHHHDLFDWGDLRRTDPVSRDWGYDRGTPVDRRYIEAFLEAHSSDVHGAVLEVQDDDFTRMAGGPRVTSSEVVDIDHRNPRATVVADLRSAPELASGEFDCVILTQTIHIIDDMAAVAREVHRVLRPGGVVLATLPAASRTSLEYGEHGDFWRVTPAGAAALFAPAFDGVEVDSFGNVLTNVAFLHGLGAEELTDAEYSVRDPYFPVIAGVRGRKGGPTRTTRGVVLLYHRVHDGSDAHGLNVPPAVFDRQLEWLQRECTIVPLGALLESAPDDLPERAVALTFDDGYVDNLENAWPLLDRRGAAATFFATTRWLDEAGEYWWDALERVLLGPGDVPSSLDVSVGGEPLQLSTRSMEERRTAHWRLHGPLVHAAAPKRDRVVAAIEAWGGGSAPRYRPMRAGELRDLAGRPGVTIGAHTVNHVALPDQAPEVRAREIAGACEALSRIAGRPVDAFAYPYGALDRDVARLARGTVRWGLTCDDAAVPESFDAARVPRLEVKAWTVEELAARVRALFEPPRAAGRALTPGP